MRWRSSRRSPVVEATIRVQPGPFDAGAELLRLTTGQHNVGGVGCFVGIVRDEAGTLDALTLEHYPGMTERALQAIAAEAIDRFALLGCTIIHRFGRLPPGAPIVLVLATSAHRQPALDATGFLIDWLKTRAPFWKQEHRAGISAWVAPRADDDLAAGRWSAP